MDVIKGDLIQYALNGEFDVIIHGCNCFCSMGGGIARLIRDHFPDAYQADLKTDMGDMNKLGSYSSATLIRGAKTLTIVNAYTQYDFSDKKIRADYTAIKKVFKKIKKDFKGKRIGYPKIGAGLANGDWQKISQIIETELKGEDHILVEYNN